MFVEEYLKGQKRELERKKISLENDITSRVEVMSEVLGYPNLEERDCNVMIRYIAEEQKRDIGKLNIINSRLSSVSRFLRAISHNQG